MSHKFKLGQTVRYAPSVPGVGAADRTARFKVVRLLPAERGICHYRLKSLIDGHERVAMEGELS
jgi:hypothetical protein